MATYFIQYPIVLSSVDGALVNQWSRGDLQVCMLVVEYSAQNSTFDFCSYTRSFTAKLLLHPQWLDSDGVVTFDNCWQQGDYTVDQVCSHRAASS